MDEPQKGNDRAPIAHKGDGVATHGLAEHLCATADLARRFAAPWGGDEAAYLAAIWHDLGKYATEFQEMIRAAGENGHLEGVDAAPKTRVDHSTAGAQQAVEKFGPVYGGMLAYVIAGHHGRGLADWSDLNVRLKSSDGLARALAAKPPAEILEIPDPNRPFPKGADASLWVRMLASALFDADFLNTEAFFDEEKAATRTANQWPTIEAMAERLKRGMAERFGPPQRDIDRLRAEVLAACRTAASRKPGFFSLTVPTGGGKTLASLAFALEHAKRHGHKRVIYAIPFTSIIEQTAGEFRKYLGEEAVLEHHSNLDCRPDEETNRSRLATENWDAPLIVTTTVQLFESLFAARPSKVRKLHNLAGGVLILDEAQALPPAVLTPVTMILDQLVRHYGVSVVLCTATQPALHDVFKELPSPFEIAPDPARLFARLDRVNVTMPKPDQKRAWTDIAAEMAAAPQALAIVNSRADCRTLHDLLPEGAIHLSTWQCAEHRAELLEKIKAGLKAEAPVRVVSTSLIEAGVDIDFPLVMRAMTGLDSLAQAAGRCNREGRLDKGRFVAFRPEDEALRGHFLQVVGAAEAALRDHVGAPFKPEAFHAYFKALYWAKGEDALDKYEMRRLLRLGEEFQAAMYHGIRFRTAAEKFHMIDDFQETLIVPYDEKAERAIASLRAIGVKRGILRALQRYTVPVRSDYLARLSEAAAVEDVDGVTVLVTPRLYHPDTGIDCEAIMDMSIEELMI